MQAAANIALEGSQTALKRFLEQGQYEAAKRDNDTAAHVAQMQSMLHLADQQAAAAREAAALAEKAAATARQAAAEAQASADLARKYAQEAQGWAAQAATSANQATASENEARQSSQRAHQALTAATADAKKANGFAAQATSSAQSASAAASRANDAASRAATSATNAGLDAEAAVKAATEAREIAASKQRAEDGADNYPPPAGKEGELTQAQIDAAYALGGDAEVQRLKDAHALTQPDALLNFIIQEGGKVLLDLIGVTDIMDCVTKGDIGACFMTLIGFAPWGKLAKLVESIPLIMKLADKVVGFVNKVGDAFSLLKKNKTKTDEVAGECMVRPGCDPIDAYRLTNPPGATANEKGQLGEYAAGIVIGSPKEVFDKALYGTTRTRITDYANETMIMEVKNVATQHYSTQIKDLLKITGATNRSEFVLVTRPDTHLTAPLIKALCRADLGFEVMVKHLPIVVGGELSTNKLVCPGG